MKASYFFLLISLILLGCQQETSIEIDLTLQPKSKELFAPGLISTGMYERDLAISPAGDELMYTLSTYTQDFRSLVSIKRTNGKWGKKSLLPFTGRYNDIEPFFSPDGQQLFFASDRPIEGDSSRIDYNLWVVKRGPNGWDEPTPLPSHINTKQDEYYPSVGSSGNLYFTATREDGVGREDIFMATWDGKSYGAVELLDSTVNTSVYEFNAFISPDEQLLVFSSYGRPDELGGGDLYVSKKGEDGKWGTAINLGEKVNTTQLDYCPFIDLERGNFYFTSSHTPKRKNRIADISSFLEMANGTENGLGDIYRIGLDQLPIPQ